MERLLLGLDGARVLDRRRREMDGLTGSGLPGRHLHRGDAVAGVRSDQQRERPGRRLQPQWIAVLLRIPGVQRFRRPEDELRRRDRAVRRSRCGRPAVRRLPARLPGHDPGGQGAGGGQLLRDLQRQGDDRGRPDGRSARRERLHLLDEIPGQRHADHPVPRFVERWRHVLASGQPHRGRRRPGLRRRRGGGRRHLRHLA